MRVPYFPKLPYGVHRAFSGLQGFGFRVVVVWDLGLKELRV